MPGAEVELCRVDDGRHQVSNHCVEPTVPHSSAAIAKLKHKTAAHGHDGEETIVPRFVNRAETASVFSTGQEDVKKMRHLGFDCITDSLESSDATCTCHHFGDRFVTCCYVFCVQLGASSRVELTNGFQVGRRWMNGWESTHLYECVK